MIKKKIIILLLSISIMISNMMIVIAEDIPDNAWDLVPLLNIGWNLGNSLENQSLNKGYVSYNQEGEAFSLLEEKLHNPTTTKQMIKAIKEAGFSSIRIPLSFYNHLLESKPKDTNGIYPGNNIDEKWLDRIEEIVSWALDEGLYVVINNHHDTSMWMELSWIYAQEDNYAYYEAHFINIWGQVAKRFKNYDHHLIFQSTGEIVNQNRSFNVDDYKDIQKAHDLNQAFITTIRNTGSNNSDRFLILETYAANSNNYFVDQNFYKQYIDSANNKLIFGVHTYESDIEALEFNFKELYKRALKYDVPFIIDECGTPVTMDNNKRLEVAKCLASSAKKYGMAIMIWDDGVSEYGLIDRKESDNQKKLIYKTKYNNKTLNSEAIVKAMINANKNTKTLSLKEKEDIKNEKFIVESFKGLNKDNIYSLLKGQYTHNNPNAYNPLIEYINVPSYYAALVPYYYAKGAHFISKHPETIETIVIKELDENFNYLRSRYNSSGNLYIPSNDAEYITIYFRAKNNHEYLTIDDYKNYVLNDELLLYQNNYDFSHLKTTISSIKQIDTNNYLIKWHINNNVDGYELYYRYGLNDYWKKAKEINDNNISEINDQKKHQEDLYYTLKSYINVRIAGQNIKLWTAFDDIGIKVNYDLEEAKNEAIEILRNYKDISKYSKELKNKLQRIINEGIDKINLSINHQEIENALNNAKNKIDQALKLNKPKLINIYNSSNGADIRFKAVENATHYVIMRKFDGKWSAIKTIKASDLEKAGGNYKYIDETIKNNYGKGYIYSVAAKNNKETSKYDLKGLALYRLKQPTITNIVSNKKGQVTLTWSKEDCHGYEVQYSSDNGKTWTKANETKETSLTINNLKSNSQYAFRIRCQKTNPDRGVGWSQYSSWAKVNVK